MNFKISAIKFAALAATLTLISSGASALTLDEALNLAMTEHPSVISRQKDLDAAESRLQGAERQQFPNLVLQSGKDYLGNRTSTYRVEQSLWTGGRLTGQIDAANAGVESAKNNLQVSKVDIMDKVIQSYTDLGRVQARIEVARANVREHERLADLIARRVGGEVSPTSDGVMGVARLSQARADLSQLMAQEARARSALAQAIGKDVGNILVPGQQNLEFTDFNTLLMRSLDYSPKLQRLDAEEKAQQADVQIKSSANWPQVVLRVDKTVGGIVPSNQTYVAVDYQSSSGFANVTQVREAMAKLESLTASKETVRRELVDQVSGDWADLQAYKLQLQDLRAQVNTTNEVFDSFVRQYAVGRKTWIDVLNSQRDVSQARYQQADADWGMLRSTLKLQLATGTLPVLAGQ